MASSRSAPRAPGVRVRILSESTIAMGLGKADVLDAIWGATLTPTGTKVLARYRPLTLSLPKQRC